MSEKKMESSQVKRSTEREMKKFKLFFASSCLMSSLGGNSLCETQNEKDDDESESDCAVPLGKDVMMMRRQRRLVFFVEQQQRNTYCI